jgi:hypothetical protein
MNYGYTDVRELNVSVQLTLHDIDRLRKCIENFEPSENVWFFKRFKEMLRECQDKAAEVMDAESKHIKRDLEIEDETN